MPQPAGARKHHTPSSVCQERGVAFVLGVSELIDDQLTPTKYGEFYKSCIKLKDYHIGEVPKRLIENEMLCALMCCCERFPAHGIQKNLYQTCVKDIIDGANELKKGRKKLPSTRFLAEPDLNIALKDVGRHRMSPGSPKRQPGQEFVRPDIGILKKVPPDPSNKVPPDPSNKLGKIVIDDFERFVEMKFPTESLETSKHAAQLADYNLFNSDITVMKPDNAINNIFEDELDYEATTEWHCYCANKRKQKLLEPGEVYSAAEEKERNYRMMKLVLDNILNLLPWTKALKGIRGLGTLGKGLTIHGS